MTAYDVKAYQISGPSWMATERYNVIAKVPEGSTKEQVNVMWQNLLAERFGVVLHHESKEFQVEELVVAKGGHKLKESTEDDPGAEGPPKLDKKGDLSGPGLVTMITMGPNGPSAHTVAKAQPLSKLTTMLGNQMNRPVLDKTGLTRKYDFNIEFTPNLPPGQLGPGTAVAAQVDNTTEPGPNLADAVQRQLGLRLVASKAKLDVVVIDKAEKVPTLTERQFRTTTQAQSLREHTQPAFGFYAPQATPACERPSRLPTPSSLTPPPESNEQPAHRVRQARQRQKHPEEREHDCYDGNDDDYDRRVEGNQCKGLHVNSPSPHG
jgi:uncharacterized protein (TIGR03435 family)